MSRHEQDNEESIQMDFSDWKPLVQAAIDFAKEYDEEYRPAIVQALLSRVGPEVASTSPEGVAFLSPRSSPTIGAPPGLSVLADDIDVSAEALERIVEISEDGTIQLLQRIDGQSVAERANRLSAVYCLVAENALGRRDVDIEELRSLCEIHGCYNRPNFTKYFRDAGLLLEIGQRGSRDKRYRLSAQGQSEARRTLRDLLAVQ